VDGAQLAPLPAVFQPLVRRLRMTSRLLCGNASRRSVGMRRRS
jgi:hypothetical protein